MADDGTERGSIVARISKSSVDAMLLPGPGKRHVLWDSEVKGFGVRIASNGARTYFLRYRIGGRASAQRMLTIGKHGSPWTAEQARRRALEILAQIRLGADPVGDRKAAAIEVEEAQALREDRMFARFAGRWLEEHVRRKGLRSENDIAGVVERDLKPAFAGKTIDEITRSDVASTLDAIGARSEAAANKAHKWLRAIYNWLIEKGLAERSPLDRMARPFDEPSRDRVLSLPELVVVWIALDRVGDPFRSFYRLLILLGQRLRETAGAPWTEIDLERQDWLLPKARTKNATDHLVPLSDQAAAIIGELRPDPALRRGPILTTDGSVPIAGFSKAKAAVDEAVAHLIATDDRARSLVGAAITPWVAHDLRRSLATGCEAMGIPLPHSEAILNHTPGKRVGVAGIYHLYEYYDEKADALQRWGDLLDAALRLWAVGDVEGIGRLDPARRRRRRDPGAPVADLD